MGTLADLGAVVLIVEDEPLVRAMAADIFLHAGYRVFEACDATDALRILEGHDDIGAVFTDIEMPGDMNGLGLATAIRGRTDNIGSGPAWCKHVAGWGRFPPQALPSNGRDR